MSLIEITNLDLTFKDKKIFSNANFVFNKGDKLGLVGINGAGKSTLLKIISGDCLMDKGNIEISSKIQIGILDQQAQIISEKNIFDYLREAFAPMFNSNNKLQKIYEEMANVNSEEELLKLSDEADRISSYLISNNFYSLDFQIEKVADGLGIKAFGMDRYASTLSGGQRAKVRLAKLLLEAPDVLLLDEPTNFLDTNHIEWLVKFLIAFDGSFMVVSHDEIFLERICNCNCDVDNLTI
jgi:ATPase subunit of ABC transporter with duplicated ATPase domains